MKNMEKKIAVLISKIEQAADLDYGSKASVRKYNRMQDWVFKTFQKYEMLNDEELGLIVKLTCHQNPLVRAYITWSLICWKKLSFEELKNYYQILHVALVELKGDIKKTYQIGIDLWKHNLSAVCNDYFPELEN